MTSFPPVLILCGGMGTRMKSVYPDLPKAMMPLNGEPFIAHQLRLLAREAVKKVILCVGYGSESIIEYVGSGHTFGIDIRYSYDGEKLLGTGGAVRQASRGLVGPFAVLYGDSYLDIALASIFNTFKKENKLGLMTVFKNNNRWIPSNVLCDSGLVLEYNKLCPRKGMQYVDYGLSVFQPQIFSAISEDEVSDLADVFLSLIKNRQLVAYNVLERFYEAGTPQGLRELESYLNKKNK